MGKKTLANKSINELIAALSDCVSTFVISNPACSEDANALLSTTHQIANIIADRNFARQLELKSIREQAQIAGLAKNAFIANMSHEIRTPLVAIIGFTDLLAHPSIQKSEMEGYLSVIRRNSDQLLRIIDDILDLSKVESGRMTIESVSFSLSDILSDFALLMGQRAREKGIDFELSAKGSLPDLVISDSTRIRQILTNVVGNAIKFTESGRIHLQVAFDSGVLEFEVIDTGIGISKEKVRSLFQPFTQGDISNTRKFGGTGLGLILTKRLCEAMGGDFQLIDSKPKHGSTFLAKIRVRVPSKSRMISSEAVRFSSKVPSFLPSESERLAGMKILLVEDSPDNQALISIVLKKSGAQVEIASDGLEGVEKAKHCDFGAIIMDVQMPKMDGHEATKTLRSLGYEMPIVAFTAHAMKEERERCMTSGFDKFLAKPLERDVMIDLLEDIYQNQKQGSFPRASF